MEMGTLISHHDGSALSKEEKEAVLLGITLVKWTKHSSV
jgi:hypothetical protein